MSRTARHRRPDRRGVSFTLLVAVPFCIAIALQGIICFGVLSNSGTTVTMKADAYDLFSERISSHAETARKPEPGISADVTETEPPKLFRRL